MDLGFSVGDPARVPSAATCPRLALDPGQVERGLVNLVLTVIELLRQVMEKQAMRRIASDSLTLDEIDRLGCSLLEVEATIKKLQAHFGIDTLNIDLGPLGTVLDEERYA